ncbi:type II toxin-antitoxin system VapC family toxin [Candidatus Poribacteria bacterium]
MEKRPRRVCLDTNVVIDYLRQTKGTEDLIEKLYLRFDEVALTVITVYELLLGVEYLDGKDRPEVEAIIRSSIILPLSEETSREAARISAELKRSGQQIGIADELIAATCKSFDACLLTGNVSHFQRIDGLQIIELEFDS